MAHRTHEQTHASQLYVRHQSDPLCLQRVHQHAVVADASLQTKGSSNRIVKIGWSLLRLMYLRSNLLAIARPISSDSGRLSQSIGQPRYIRTMSESQFPPYCYWQSSSGDGLVTTAFQARLSFPCLTWSCGFHGFRSGEDMTETLLSPLW